MTRHMTYRSWDSWWSQDFCHFYRVDYFFLRMRVFGWYLIFGLLVFPVLVKVFAAEDEVAAQVLVADGRVIGQFLARALEQNLALKQ